MKMSPPPVDYLRCLYPPNPADGAGAQQPPCRPGRQNSSAKAAARSQQRPKKGSSGGGSGYRHVPHKDKPPQMVARRNARERRRVQAVNSAFYNLRMAVPGDSNASRGKRVSKVKTLQRAIDYIYVLQDLLTSADESTSASSTNQDYTPNSSLASDGASLSSGNVSSSTACWGDCNNCANCTSIAAYSNTQILIENFQY
ncbi:achaete-scute complex protein T3-like [Cloeon dipterum]|uniref:achaete-scute complex protein T3-like n=1 Tax=Cloeon dipterum TaxID=197152 RepID=UPI00321F8D0D